MSDISDTPTPAKEQAKQVGSQAADSAGQVAQTAASETKDVAAQAASSAKDLFHQVRGEVGDQAGTQQQRIASGLSALADQLEEMGQGQQSGLASSLVSQVADRARTTGDWLSSRQPDEVMEEARRFAARRPGTFLAAAAAVGFLGARLTRGLSASASGTTASGADHLPERSFPPAPSPLSSMPPVDPEPYGEPLPAGDRGYDDVDELADDLPGLPEDPGAPLDTPPGRAPGVTPPVAPRVGGGGEML